MFAFISGFPCFLKRRKLKQTGTTWTVRVSICSNMKALHFCFNSASGALSVITKPSATAMQSLKKTGRHSMRLVPKEENLACLNSTFKKSCKWQTVFRIKYISVPDILAQFLFPWSMWKSLERVKPGVGLEACGESNKTAKGVWAASCDWDHAPASTSAAELEASHPALSDNSLQSFGALDRWCASLLETVLCQLYKFKTLDNLLLSHLFKLQSLHLLHAHPRYICRVHGQFATANGMSVYIRLLSSAIQGLHW